MTYYYTNERNSQIVIALLKSHGIKKVIASPGTTNICLVSSMQRDPYFEMYSAPEERSAGYMACGLAAESGEPVVITCTGATASRNYLPALTEAFYRKLPILAITCSRRNYRIGHNIDQVTDRTQLPKDVAKISVQVPLVYDCESEWNDVIMVNKAILELTHNGKGPSHINLETNYSTNYSVEKLPDVRSIFRIKENDSFPNMPQGRIAIFVGSHLKWNDSLTESVDDFCERHNCVVLCDHTSNYKGKYRILANVIAQQTICKSILLEEIDLLIHIGDVHAPGYELKAKNVWRVNPDGELRDTFKKLKYVFEMDEEIFFKHYLIGNNRDTSFYYSCKDEMLIAQEAIVSKLDNMPFSNAWIASQTSYRLPSNSVLHLGIQNSLRFWNFFEIPSEVLGYSNVGGFGIDGSLSAVIGASLANSHNIYYCILGDLAFFYDLNSLGNRHVSNNLRILLVNNGKGTEFKLSGNPGHLFGEETDKYIAAAGHYGNKSDKLVKHYAEDLGFEYLCASSKEEYLDIVGYFISPNMTEKPVIFEVFTNSEDEDRALTIIREAVTTRTALAKKQTKKLVKEILGDKGVEIVKRIIQK